MSQDFSQVLETWHKGQRSTRIDQLAAEAPLEILIDHCDGQQWHRHNIAVTMRTPGADTELALGFLLSEAIIGSYDDIEQIDARLETDRQRIIIRLRDQVRLDIKKLSRHLFTSSSCGICSKTSLDLVQMQCPRKPLMQQKVTAEVLLQMPKSLRQAQATFSLTGGLHASGIFQRDGQLVYLREDVGRHNALDKAIGKALQAGPWPLDEHILLLSGRASFELIQKAAMAGLAFVAALGAPSSLASALAQSMDMTLIGFLREDSFNIYCGGQRIT